MSNSENDFKKMEVKYIRHDSLALMVVVSPTRNEPKCKVNGKWRSIGGEGHENVIVLHQPFRLSEKCQRSNLKLY